MLKHKILLSKVIFSFLFNLEEKAQVSKEFAKPLWCILLEQTKVVHGIRTLLLYTCTLDEHTGKNIRLLVAIEPSD